MLATGFVILTLFSGIMLLFGLSKAATMAIPDALKRNAFRVRASIFIFLWLVYISVLSLRGVFISGALPPRIPLLLVFPAFAFIAFFFAGGKFKNIISTIPASWPVYFQSFRILVELLLFGMMVAHIVPKEVTFEGYNFDVLIGLSAPVVGWLAFQRKALGRNIVILWNLAGLCTLVVVSFVFISQAYFPAVWHRESILGMGFGLFPYTYLAGFLMPVAVFMHILSIVKLRVQ